MKIKFALFVVFATSIINSLLINNAYSQQGGLKDDLLDCMTGDWILTGTIAGKETTHDITAEWILAHQYIKLHEISREKDSVGQPQYEAMVLIGWDQILNQYSCLWLDITGGGGLSAGAIGHAKKEGNEIPFLFKGSDGSVFHTTFIYEKSTNSWNWVMDNEEKGKLIPFARVTLKKQIR